MTLAPVGYGSTVYFGSNLAHKSHALVVTSLALNIIQNIPGANAFETAMAGKAIGLVFDKIMGSAPAVNGVVSAINKVSDLFTLKNILDRICDPNLLNLPQFKIPFRAGMTAVALIAEALVCKTAMNAYTECAGQQAKIVQECWDKETNNRKINEMNSKINSMNRKTENCMKLSDEKAKDECILKSIDDYNESEAKEKGDFDPLLKECLATKPSCTVLWLTRDTSCAAMGGHAAFAAWAIGKGIFGN